jgi:hypothetical protein
MLKEIVKNELTVSEIASRYSVEKRIVLGWIQRGILPNARKEQSPFGVEFWLVPETDLEGFEPQKRRGRPKATNPSKATLAKRRQRKQEIQTNKAEN